MQAALAASRDSKVRLRHVSFLRLAHRLSATALSRQQPVLPTESPTSLAAAQPASRAPVYCEPLSELNRFPLSSD